MSYVILDIYINLLKKRLQNLIILTQVKIEMKNSWLVGGDKTISLNQTSVLMGILNMTPDSFSDGGKHSSLQDATRHALKMLDEGATILDIGGESTRPGFNEVTVTEEQGRVLPVVRKLIELEAGLLSIDTYHAETARIVLEAGAHIVNDIWGLQKDPDMADLVAEKRAGIVIMHNSRNRDVLPDVIEDQKFYFDKSLNIASKAGISDDAIVLDPGFGFGKNFQDNLDLLNRASELRIFGFPLLAATSRKHFLGIVTGRKEPKMRDIATVATSVLLRQAGFSIFRVHDVALNKDALAITDAVLKLKGKK